MCLCFDCLRLWVGGWGGGAQPVQRGNTSCPKLKPEHPQTCTARDQRSSDTGAFMQEFPAHLRDKASEPLRVPRGCPRPGPRGPSGDFVGPHGYPHCHQTATETHPGGGGGAEAFRKIIEFSNFLQKIAF